MALLIDLFGCLSVVPHGLSLAAQAVAVGGVAYLVVLAWPLAPRLGNEATVVSTSARQVTVWAGSALAVVAGLRLVIQLAVLVEVSGISLSHALGASFVAAWAMQAI